MPVSISEFVEQAASLGVLSVDEIQACVNDLKVVDRPQDSEQLARLLVKQQRLTAFQAQQLYQGKGKSLVVGSYLLLDKLGEGGMAAVFKARHRTMNRIVAIKILPRSESKNPEAVRRFQREAEAAARLKHPNIVSAYDADESDGIHYLVMEYIDGTDLGKLVERQGPLPVEQAVSYVTQAARGLAYAHKCGVIHRDIKPSNLVLDSQGMVRILDMGIARIESSGEQDKLTKTGHVVGTVDFIAPEQAVDTRTADARADIYSLGVTLWYLLTGRLLYDGTSLVMKLLAHQNNPIPSLREACPDVSPHLEAAFTRMVAKDPADRYRNMPEVLGALQGTDVKTVTADLGVTGVWPARAESPPAADDRDDVDAEKPAKSRSRHPKSRSAESPPETTPVPLWLHPWVWTGIGVLGFVGLLSFILFNEARDRDSLVRGEAAAVNDSSIRKLGQDDSSAVSSNGISMTPSRPLNDVSTSGLSQSFTNSIGMQMRGIPAGEFRMGSLDGKGAGDEHPQHLVRITRPFYAGKYEVTIGEALQWLNAPGVTIDSFWVTDGGNFSPVRKSGSRWVLNTASKFGRSDRQPMQSISWDGAVAFCEWLSRKEGRTYRLPTEAEWEYMARAGSTTAYPWGETCDAREANINGASEKGPNRQVTTVVGSFRPNHWDLYDTAGNVLEWCGDWYDDHYYSRSPTENPPGPESGSSRVLRGGSWDISEASARSANRRYFTPDSRNASIGFRVVAEFESTKPVAKVGDSSSPPPASPDEPPKMRNTSPPPPTVPAEPPEMRTPNPPNPAASDDSPEITNSIGMKLRRIPAGEFLMGSNSSRRIPESPQHKVSISRPFLIGIHEVTKGQFAEFVKETDYITLAEPESKKLHEYIWGAGYDKDRNLLMPRSSTYSWKETGFPQTDDHPVVNVAWIDAVAFCDWLSTKENVKYRLPTEAEWEYACRAGSTGAYHCGNNAEDLARFGNIADLAFNRLKPDGRFGSITADDGHVFTAAVGQYEPNAFGLHDLHGNVWEWCSDWYAADYYLARQELDPSGPTTGSQRVLRGGSWLSTKVEARCVHRYPSTSDYRDAGIGFRVVAGLNSAGPPVNIEESSSLLPAIPDEPPEMPTTSPPGTGSSKDYPLEFTNSIGMQLRLIPAGEFLMGSPDGQGANDEHPQHLVRITRPFYAGKYEVTIGEALQWLNAPGVTIDRAWVTDGGGVSPVRKSGSRWVLNTASNKFGQADLQPMQSISWDGAVAFCEWLSRKEGRTYRLPTEAEWEYMARAGSTTAYPWGDTCNGREANVLGKFPHGTSTTGPNRQVTTEVGTYPPNAWGLYDTVGNVAEWCGDLYDERYYSRSPTENPQRLTSGSSRVLRGGSWAYSAIYARSAYRSLNAPVSRDSYVGFRVVAE